MSNAQGIDVYEGTGVVDWKQVAASGHVFADIKAAEGTTVRDTRYKINFEEAGAEGLLRLAYFYVHPNDDPTASITNFLAATEGTTPELGYAFDIEVTDGVTPEQLQAFVDACATELSKQTGEPPLDYSYPAFISGNKLRFSLSRGSWIASYGRKPSGDWTFWQYSSTGHVPGVIGDCDLDEFNGTIDQLKEWAGIVDEVKILVKGEEFPTNGVMYKGSTMVPWTFVRDYFAKDLKAKEIDASKFGTPYAFDFVGEPDGTTVIEKPVKADVTLTYADGSKQTL